MRLLGNIWWMLLVVFPLFGAEAYMERSAINVGSPAVLILKAEGKNVEFPEIDAIDGFMVASRQTRQSIEVRNGVYQKRLEKFYTFYPDRNVTVPSFGVVVDGKEEATKPLHVTIVTTQDANKMIPFVVETTVDNPSPYKGELFKVSVVFKRDANVEVAQLQLLDPQFDGFWIKGTQTHDPYFEGGYITQKATYWLAPQREGKMRIEPIVVNVATKVNGRDIFNMLIDQVQWQRVRSKESFIDVKPLPDGVNLVGDFTLKVYTDTKEVEAGKPVNVRVEVRGNGNIDDIPPVKIVAKDTIIFEDKPMIKGHVEQGHYRGIWEKKFALTPSHDTTIEALEIPYFNPTTHRVERMKSDPIALHVKGSLPQTVIPQSTTTLPEASPQKELSLQHFFGAVVGGIVLGMGLVLVWQRRRSVQNFVHLSTSERELLRQLLPYQGKDEVLDSWIERLEMNCYGGEKHPIARKEIKKILEMLS